MIEETEVSTEVSTEVLAVEVVSTVRLVLWLVLKECTEIARVSGWNASVGVGSPVPVAE